MIQEKHERSEGCEWWAEDGTCAYGDFHDGAECPVYDTKEQKEIRWLKSKLGSAIDALEELVICSRARIGNEDDFEIAEKEARKILEEHIAIERIK